MLNPAFSRFAVVASLFLLGAVGCTRNAAIVLTFETPEELADAKSLHLRLVGPEGPYPATLKYPEGDGVVSFPFSMEIPVANDASWVGAVAWVKNKDGKIVRLGVSHRCMRVTANVAANYGLGLGARGSETFQMTAVKDCRCNAEDPKVGMCPDSLGAVGPEVLAPGTPAVMPDAGVPEGTSSVGTGMGGSPMPASPKPDPAPPAPDKPKADAAAPTMMPPAMMMPPVPTPSKEDAGVMMPPRREDMAALMPPPGMGATNTLFSFENDNDWTSTEAKLSKDTQEKTHGNASLSFMAKGKIFVRSRAFASNEAPAATNKLSLDVWVAEMPGSSDNIQMRFDCRPAAYDVYLGYKELSKLTPGAWSQVVFDVPGNAVDALKGQNTGCKLWMEHNGQGLVRYDRLSFVP